MKFDTLYNEQLTHEAQRKMMTMSVLALNLGTPEDSDDDHFVAETDMQNGEYTLAETKPDVARNVLITVTQVNSDDTMGLITVKGKDALGGDIEEVIAPNANTTKAGDLAFAEITSITGSGWAVSGSTNYDQIKIGTGVKLGLPLALASAASILVNIVANAVQTYTAAVGDPATVAETTVDAQSGTGTYDGSNSVVVLVSPE